MDNAGEWSEAAAKAKGLASDSRFRAEDLLTGPTVVARQLRLTIQTLSRINSGENPALPGAIKHTSDRVEVPVFPTRGFYDSLTFMGLRGVVRMQPDVEVDEVHGNLIEIAAANKCTGITGVLGAGNVSSIPATDSLNRIMFEGKRVILKMNPVNEYLSVIFAKAFKPLIEARLLTIVKGGAEIGNDLVRYDDVVEIHITGSAATHDAIVWGTENQQERRDQNQPVIKKAITSELGNVTPWIVVPGNYSSRQLLSQARHIAASITNNVSFNCLATKVIITWSQWPQRETFLTLLKDVLAATATRPSYYPGAVDRYVQFTGNDSPLNEEGHLPWTLLTDQKIDEHPHLFESESFVCVCAETALEADSPTEFLNRATEFVNERIAGTLCCSLTFPKTFRRQHADHVARALDDLKYGSVCVNQWSGLAYGLISPPWGAYPGATLQNIQSGIGAVHNTFLLDKFEKTILEGPLVNFPHPVWFPDHRKGIAVAERLLAMYEKPSPLRLPALFAAALTG